MARRAANCGNVTVNGGGYLIGIGAMHVITYGDFPEGLICAIPFRADDWLGDLGSAGGAGRGGVGGRCACARAAKAVKEPFRATLPAGFEKVVVGEHTAFCEAGDVAWVRSARLMPKRRIRLAWSCRI